MTKSAKASLVLILFLTSSISSMHQFTLPSLNDKKSSLILLCCAATAIGLSYLGYQWIKKPIEDNNTQKITTPTITKYPTKSIGTQVWIETNDNITLSINTKNYLPKCGLRYLLEKYKQQFGHYNDAETPLKIGRSLRDLKLLQKVSRNFTSNMTKFNFNTTQQTALLEMASAFKIHKLYLTLLNNNLPNDINTQQITPYSIALTRNIPELYDKIITFIKKNTLTWQMWIKDYTSDCRYRVCSDDRRDYTWIWDNKILIPIENSKYLPRDYHIFPHKNLVLFSGYHDQNRPNEKYSTFIYDIKNNKRYYLDVKTQYASITISPDEKHIAVSPHGENLIYVLNIDDLDHIKYYKALKHKNVIGIVFSPNSKLLASSGNGIKLWNTNKLNAKPKTLLHGIECCGPIVFNKDNEHLCATISLSDNKFKLVTLNINNPEKYKFTNICVCSDCDIFPKNSDFIIYSERVRKQIADHHYTTEETLKIINKHGNELFSQKDRSEGPLTITISDNLKHIGISTPKSRYGSHMFCNFITINKNYISARTPDMPGKCEAINDDGSFWIDSPEKKIILYDSTLKLIATSNYPTVYRDSPYIRPIVFSDNIKQIKPILNDLTLTQYNLLKKACDSSREKGSLLSIKHNSFDHNVLKSFGAHEQYISNILKLQITS